MGQKLRIKIVIKKKLYKFLQYEHIQMNKEVKGLFYLGSLYAIVYCGEEPAVEQLNSVVQSRNPILS